MCEEEVRKKQGRLQLCLDTFDKSLILTLLQCSHNIPVVRENAIGMRKVFNF